MKHDPTTTGILEQYPATPELDKMKSIHARSQTCGEFLEWLEVDLGIQLGKPHVHGPECPGWDEERNKYNPGEERCQYRQGEFQYLHMSREKLLAMFFEIDLNKVEEERIAILEYIRRKT